MRAGPILFALYALQMILGTHALVLPIRPTPTGHITTLSAGNTGIHTTQRSRRIVLPIQRRPKRPSTGAGTVKLARDDANVTGAAGLGDVGDLLYTVSINVGNISTEVHLDTGSSDLWVISDACKSGACANADGTAVRASTLNLTGADVKLNYGDSKTGTSASGPIARDRVTLAGIELTQQPFGAINATDNTVVGPNVPSSGIFGLGFPSGSTIQANVAQALNNNSLTIDDFLLATSTLGPVVSRLVMQGDVEQPLLAITLQRNTIDIGGNEGSLSIGELPNGVNNASLTWVPVRLYPNNVGGLMAPSFAPNEAYPLRWEVVIDDVFFNGKKLPNPSGSVGPISALIDSGNSLIRGPKDVVNNIFTAASPSFSPSRTDTPTASCKTPQTLAFQIGGKLFPVDPRDFIGEKSPGNAETCALDKLVSTDPPNKSGRLYSWSLGDPFLKSNLVAFYYGNLTHPSVDPPRIGFLSTIPSNADQLLQDAIEDAEKNGGSFENTVEAAPTGTLPDSVLVVPTLSANATSSQARGNARSTSVSLTATSDTGSTISSAESSSLHSKPDQAHNSAQTTRLSGPFSSIFLAVAVTVGFVFVS